MNVKMVDAFRDNLDPLTQPLFVQDTGAQSIFLIDTSTLIYLEKIALLELALTAFSLTTVSQIVTEFGRHPEGLSLCPADRGKADQVLLQTAADMRAAVLSDDGKVLEAARREGLYYYNSLMVVLALYCRKQINRMWCDQSLARLYSFAHYSDKVQAYGRKLFERLVRSE